MLTSAIQYIGSIDNKNIVSKKQTLNSTFKELKAIKEFSKETHVCKLFNPWKDFVDPLKATNQIPISHTIVAFPFVLMIMTQQILPQQPQSKAQPLAW